MCFTDGWLGRPFQSDVNVIALPEPLPLVLRACFDNVERQIAFEPSRIVMRPRDTRRFDDVSVGTLFMVTEMRTACPTL